MSHLHAVFRYDRGMSYYISFLMVVAMNESDIISFFSSSKC